MSEDRKQQEKDRDSIRWLREGLLERYRKKTKRWIVCSTVLLYLKYREENTLSVSDISSLSFSVF
jgi:hypothetical protein